MIAEIKTACQVHHGSQTGTAPVLDKYVVDGCNVELSKYASQWRHLTRHRSALENDNDAHAAHWENPDSDATMHVARVNSANSTHAANCPSAV